MMNSFFASRTPLLPIALLAGALVAVSACSSSDDPEPDAKVIADGGGKDTKAEPTGPQPYGAACEGPDGCESKLCIDGYCSKLCRKLADCEPVRGTPDASKPAGTLGGKCMDDGTCGKGLTCYLGKECLMAFDCGRADEQNIACYPRTYDIRPFTAGHDCSTDTRCAQSYRCMGQKGTPDRFCSPSCEQDKECPPEMRCAKMRTLPGETERRCMPRKMGHPCEIDDQCGGAQNTELGCVQDPQGNDYCSKTCSPTDPGTCPPYAECKEVGNGRKMCAYKAGKAYTEGGKLCDPCIHHGENDGSDYYEEGGCTQGGFCMVLSPYTGESSCITPCDAAGNCPPDHACFELKTEAGAKVCAPTKPIPGMPGQVTISPCYPSGQ